MKLPTLTARRLTLPFVAVALVLALMPRWACDLYGPPLRDVLSRLLAPLSHPLTVFGSRIHGHFEKPVLAGGDAHRLSDELQQREGRIIQLERRVKELELVVAELEGLRRRLGFSYKFHAARVIGRSSDAAARTLQIDLGTSDGLAAGQPVVQEGNLIGRVAQTGLKSSSVLPITAMNSFIEVLVLPPTLPSGRIPDDRRRTIQLKPRTADLLVADDVPRTTIIEVGDYCRLDDRGPEGWPGAVQGMIVGSVTKVGPHPDDPLRQRVEVRPMLPLQYIESVTVIVPVEGSP